MSPPQRLSAASAPSNSKTPRPGAADRHVPRAGTSTLLPPPPSRLSSLRRRSKFKELPSSAEKRAKPSFLTRLVHKLVSCVGLNTRAHDIDTDSVASVASGPPSRADRIPEKAPQSTSRAPQQGRPDRPSDPTSAGVQPPGSSCPVPGSNTSSNRSSEDSVDSADRDVEVPPEEIFDDQDMMLLRNGGAGIPIGHDGVPRPLLPPMAPEHSGRKCLVLDLDETLVHSNFRPIPDPDFIVPIEIENHWHNMYVQKRPGVDDFLRQMGEMYEVVVYTASLSAYADPVMDHLDMYNAVSHRLFRENCYRFKGNFVKDLSQLGRPIEDTIIIDNSPASYIFHPTNAVPISSWFNDPHDTELLDLCPFLVDLAGMEDMRTALNPGL